jgi:hypothetical protein
VAEANRNKNGGVRNATDGGGRFELLVSIKTYFSVNFLSFIVLGK